MASDPYTQWTAIDDSELTVNDVRQHLGGIRDDVWVSAACADRIVDDVEVQQALLDLGAMRTEAASQRCKKLLETKELVCSGAGSPGGSKELTSGDTLANHLPGHEEDATLCRLRLTLLQRLDKLSTFKAISAVDSSSSKERKEEASDEWEDDPWELTSGEPDSPKDDEEETHPGPPFSLLEFLSTDIVAISCSLASQGHLQLLRIVLQRHWERCWPYRLVILDGIPEYIHPSEYSNLLPSIDTHSGVEKPAIASEPWRTEDYVETFEAQAAFQPLQDTPPNEHRSPSDLPNQPAHLSSEEICKWYISRAESIIRFAGPISNAIALIQHGAAQGIPGLDELGEELTLVSRLVYDAPQSTEITDDWTLDKWRAMDPFKAVQAFLRHSTPDSLPGDLKKLVIPYLFVLESRAERQGRPDPDISTRLLHQYILSAPLDMVASIFEASKPTLPLAQRLIRDEDDVARLALACLYSSDSLDQWSTMSRLFECLPAWDMGGGDNEEDAADSTIESLAAFLTPSTTIQKPSASDIAMFFKPLPRSALSRALDVLDVHLESGEILARWGVAAPLRWFLRSNSNVDEQRAWANRMARRAGGAVHHIETIEDWEWLLEDMLKISGGAGTKSCAFGLLDQKEVMRLYLAGLLSTGNFSTAHELLYSEHPKLNLDREEVEEICLTCSRDFYDNAESGNYKFGDMRLAYDCLEVPQSNKRIIQEKDFIEATSRIASFNVMSRPGIPISPLEIRLTKDRLSLISQVLSSNNDAYKHTEVILDLTRKLGFRDDVNAEIKTIAMLADSALQAEDFARAYELCERLVATVETLGAQAGSSSASELAEAYEVCWLSCLQLGRQSEFEDIEKKLSLLGRALEFCPPEQLHDVLASWRRMESEAIEHRQNNLSHSDTLPSTVRAPREHGFIAPKDVTSSLKARLREFHMPSPPLLSTPDAAALASRTFRSVAANFPFSGGQRSHSSLSEQDHDAESTQSSIRRIEEDVSAQASRALSKGIGWLLGGDDDL